MSKLISFAFDDYKILTNSVRLNSNRTVDFCCFILYKNNEFFTSGIINKCQYMWCPDRFEDNSLRDYFESKLNKYLKNVMFI